MFFLIDLQGNRLYFSELEWLFNNGLHKGVVPSDEMFFGLMFFDELVDSYFHQNATLLEIDPFLQRVDVRVVSLQLKVAVNRK